MKYCDISKIFKYCPALRTCMYIIISKTINAHLRQYFCIANDNNTISVGQ